jgi:hypothetical protein
VELFAEQRPPMAAKTNMVGVVRSPGNSQGEQEQG